MGGVLSSIVSVLGGRGSKDVEVVQQGPSPEETAAQKREQELVDAKTQRETAERASRAKIITARAAGPQTLFAAPGSIPRPIKLGGGQRA